jgi:parvulin-like peptidyl-prolyl isomerase
MSTATATTDPGMTRVRRIVAAAVVVAAIGAGGWYVTADHGGPATSAGTEVARPPDRGGVGPRLPASAGGPAAATPPGVDAGLARPLLDCLAPAGDVVAVGAAAITAAAVCDELLVVAGPPTRPPSAAWRAQAHQLRDQLVDELLVRLALASAGLAVTDAEVDAAVAALPRAATRSRPSAGEAAVLRRQLRARLELARLVASDGEAALSDAELRALYAEDPARFGEPAEARVTPFARRLPPARSDDEVAAAADQVDGFLAAVAAGTAPAKAATTAGLTALAPFVLEDRGVEPELRAAAFGLDAGQWTEPVETRIGWVVLRVDAVRPGKVPPFEQVRDRVRAAAMAAADLDRRARVLATLRADAPIVDLVTW